MFTVFGLLHWAKFYYGKNAKYLLDEAMFSHPVLWGVVIDRGIICFLFGTIQFLINAPGLQLWALAIVELLWIVKKSVYILKGLHDEKWLVCVSLFSGLCRLFFQFTCYLY
jgi:hypothetical protein